MKPNVFIGSHLKFNVPKEPGIQRESHPGLAKRLGGLVFVFLASPLR